MYILNTFANVITYVQPRLKIYTLPFPPAILTVRILLTLSGHLISLGPVRKVTMETTLKRGEMLRRAIAATTPEHA